MKNETLKTEDINMKWIFEKFKGDLAVYAFCPKCNFRHNPSRVTPKTMEVEIVCQYKYCPMCGEYLYDDRDNLDVIWNERDVTELYK